MSGKFITLEGSEGAGKSTNLEVVQRVLDDHGIAHEVTREPGGTPLAEEIRELILNNREEPVAASTELLLMFAARVQHVEQKIKPLLADGVWVLCDRFIDATYAYQGYGRGIGLQHIEALDAWLLESVQPDLTIYLDLPPEIGAARIANREQDRMEQERADFFAAVRSGYVARAAQHNRIKTVDASGELAEVSTQVARVVTEFIKS